MPFTIEQFLGVFESYNKGIWPVQVFAYALGSAAFLLAFRQGKPSSRMIGAILSAFWLWTGIVYHILYFSSINRPAMVFGSLFILQGVLFLLALLRGNLAFKPSLGAVPGIGVLFVLYAMIIYPVIGYFSGHGYPRSPTFGVTPCPVTIFTFGLLLLTSRRVPKYLVVIPFLWSLLGAMAATKLGIREDIGLLIAGVLGTILIILRDRRTKPWAD